MAQTTNQLQLEQVAWILKARMARGALLHVDKVDIHTGTVLEVAGLFRRTAEEVGDAELAEIILEKSHPRRVATAGGPTLFYRDAKNKKQQFAVDMRTILLNTDAQLRKAAWEHFAALSDERPSCLSARTRRALEENRQALLLTDAAKWQPVALKLHDLIEEDLLCQIAGARQSIKERYEDGLRYYVPRLLRPTLNALEGLDLRFMNPSEQRDQTIAEVNELIERASSLRTACEAYLATLGTLPLAGAASFTEMVRIWTTRHGASQGLWNEIWEWATTASPVAQFYGCIYFLTQPQQVPEDSRGKAANALLELLKMGNENERLEKNQWFWKVARELAQHYLRHFETRAPGALGEPLAIGSWWLAEQLSEVLCDNLAAASHLRDIALLPEARNSELAWRFANARIATSPTSIATHWTSSPWQIALLGAIQQPSADTLREVLTDQQRAQLESDITKHLLLWCPTTIASDSKATYLFEAELQKSVGTWTTIFGPSERTEFLAEIARLYPDFVNPESFFDRFKDIGNTNEADQVILANSAKLLSLREALPLDPIWEKLTDSKWRSETFRKLTPVALELLFVAFSSSLHRGGDKWAASLPHLYAHACEDVRGDAERTELLFIFTVISCIHSYSVSATERLLTGEMRPELLELGRRWRAQLLNSSRAASPWVVARIRAVTAAISASL